MSSGSFSAECAVRPLSKSVAAIPDDATASAILLCDRMVANISEINVLLVPPGASIKYNLPRLLVTASIILSYAKRCSGSNF
jgi:hypothetical protein